MTPSKPEGHDSEGMERKIAEPILAHYWGEPFITNKSYPDMEYLRIAQPEDYKELCELQDLWDLAKIGVSDEATKLALEAFDKLKESKNLQGAIRAVGPLPFRLAALGQKKYIDTELKRLEGS
jgi:hypothetical protein